MPSQLRLARRLTGGVTGIAVALLYTFLSNPPKDVYPDADILTRMDVEAESEGFLNLVADSASGKYVSAVSGVEKDYYDENLRLPKSIADQVTFIGTQHGMPYHIALASFEVFALEAGIDVRDLKNVPLLTNLLEKNKTFVERYNQLVSPSEANPSGRSLTSALETALKEAGVSSNVKLVLELALDLRGANKNTEIIKSKDVKDIVDVEGLKVNVLIADEVKELLAEGREAGFDFATGSGAYRSDEAQIEARIANGCGHRDGENKQQDVQHVFYDRPSACSKAPTARPGLSNHKRGLALDLKVNGQPISSNPDAFQWLSENAPDHHLHNLASEPWHWSINGN